MGKWLCCLVNIVGGKQHSRWINPKVDNIQTLQGKQKICKQNNWFAVLLVNLSLVNTTLGKWLLDQLLSLSLSLSLV